MSPDSAASNAAPPVRTRDRILGSSAELFGRQGYHGTGLKQIVTAANAPFGSLYHFFPNGKEQLGDEVIRWSGEMYRELIAAVFDPAPDVVTAVGDFFTGAAEHLRDTDYADACPIATVALEVASVNEPLRQATAAVFTSWLTDLSTRFETAGIDPERARELGVEAFAALEGAFVLCRATRSTEPLAIAGRAVASSVRAALPPP